MFDISGAPMLGNALPFARLSARNETQSFSYRLCENVRGCFSKLQHVTVTFADDILFESVIADDLAERFEPSCGETGRTVDG